MKSLKKKANHSQAKPGSRTLNQKSNAAHITAKNKKTKTVLPEGMNAAHALIDAFPDAALLTDTKGIILFANEAFTKRMGKSIEQLAGSSAYDLLPPDRQRARRKKIREIIRTGEPAHFEDQRGGMILENTLYPIKDEKGKVTCIAACSRDITNYRQAEAKSQTNRDQLALIFESVSDMMMLLSTEPDGRLIIEALNQSFMSMSHLGQLGLDIKNMVGRDRAEVWLEAGFSPENIAEWERPMRKAIKTRKPVKYEEYVPLHGGLLIQEVSCVPTLNEKGRVTHLLWTAHNITERKQTEKKLQQHAEAMSALYDTMRDLIVERDLSKLLNIIVERATRLVNVKSGGLYLCEPQNKLLRCEVSYKTPRDYTGITLKYGEGVAGRIAQTGESFVIGNYKKWKGRAKAYEEEPFRAILGVPMKWQGEVIGVLEILEHGWERTFTQEEQELIELFANQAAMAVHNARLHEQAQRELAERKRTEETLRASEAKYRMLIDSMEEGVWVIDTESRTTFTNPQMAKILGYTDAEMLGKSLFEFMDDEGRALAGINVERRKQGITEQLDFKFKHKNGNDAWAFLSTNPILGPDGQYTGAMAVITDITERKRAEDAIRQQEALLETFFSQSLDGFFFMMLDKPIEWNDAADKDQLLDYAFTHQRMTKVNDAMLAQYGVPREQFIGLTPNDLMPHDIPYGKNLWRSLFDDGRLSIKTSEQKLDGTPMWIEGEYVCLYDERGRITGHFGIQREITAQKQLEDELRIKNDAVASSSVGTSFTDMNGKIIYVNNAWLKIFDYESQEQVLGTSPTDYTKDPADADMVMQAIAADGQWLGELIGKKRDGSEFDFQLAANLVRNESGEPIALLGSFLDITETKRGHAALQRSEALLSDAQRISHIGSWELDLQTNHLIWSDEIYRIFEIDPQRFEASYEAFLNAIHPDDRDIVNKAYTDSVENHSHYKIEHRLLMENGNIKYVEEQGETFYNHDGKPVRSIGTVHDITGRILTEQQLHSERNFTNAILENAGALVVVLDHEGRVRRFNRASEELSGFSFEEIDGKFPWDTFLPPEDAATIRTQAFEALANNPQSMAGEYTNYWAGKNGERYLIEWNNTLITDDDGRMQFMVSVGIDITEREKAEANVREQARLLDMIFKYSQDGMAILDKDYNFIRVTESYAKAGARDADEFVGKNHFEMYPSDFKEEADDVKHGKYTYSRNARPFVYPDHPEWGATYWDVGFVPILGADKEVELFLLTLKNVTERVTSAEALQASEDLLRRSQQVALMGSWRMNLVTNQITWSEEVYRIFEKDPQEFNVSYETFLGMLHPDDREVINKTYWDSVEGHDRYDITHRLPLPDGRIKYILEQGETFYDEDGNPIYTIGIAQDVTERKQAEKALQESEIQLSLVFNSTADMQILLRVEANAQFIVQTANRAYMDMVKSIFPAAANLIGKDRSDYMRTMGIPDPEIEKELPMYRSAVETRAEVVYEIEFPSPMGIINLDVTISPVLDQNGTCTHVLWTARDITERKRAEQELRVKDNAIESSFNAIAISGADGNLTYVNSAFVKLWGLGDRDEALGHSALEFWIKPEDAIQVIGIIQEHGIWSGEMAGKRRNGDLFDALVSASVVKDENGQVTHMMASFIDITTRKEAEEYIKASLHEKEILLKEIHHRVKNNLQVISSLLYLQSRKIQSAEMKDMFIESQNRVGSMAMIHEKLYQSTDLAHMAFGTYARELALTLYQTYGVETSRVALSVEGDGIELDINNAVPCGLILNEIISNSLKYAFPEDRQGQIQIKLSMADDDRFHLVISDNGVGLPADFEARTAKSLGIKLISRLAEQMEGNVERNSSSSGTSYHITFPRRAA